MVNSAFIFLENNAQSPNVSCNAKTSIHHDQYSPTPKKPKQIPHVESLDGGLVCDWYDGLWYVVLHGNGSRLSWHGWLSLQVDVCALGLCLLLQLGVCLDSSDELLSRSGKGNVLDTEVDALLDVTVLDLLVDDDADCALGDIVDDSSLSVVNLVWHTIFNISTIPYLHLPASILSHRSSMCDWRSGVDSPLLDGTVCLDINNVSNPVRR